MRKVYAVSALVIVSQVLCMYVSLSSLLHFHTHPVWLNALNSLALPAYVFNIYNSATLILKIREDHKATLARLARLHAQEQFLLDDIEDGNKK